MFLCYSHIHIYSFSLGSQLDAVSISTANNEPNADGEICFSFVACG